MIKTFKALALGLNVLLSVPAYSETPTEKLGTCLVDALNGKERKQLAKWVFFAIASHPDLSSLSNVTVEDRDAADRFFGVLVTRLLTENCPAEMKAASDFSPLAMQKAFEMVGQVAMTELMTNQQVKASVVSYLKYADMEKINSIMTAPSR